MKNLIILLACFAFACSSVKPIPFTRSGSVECVGKDRTTISLSSQSFAHTAEIAQEYAIRNAFENLLFKGVPNSNQERAMVPNESDFIQDHSSVYNNLVKKKDYQLFIIDSSVENMSKTNGGYNSSVYLKIDLGAFRDYLVKEGAVRKFGI